MTLQQNCGFDLEGQGQGGQGPKFNHFYSRQRENFSENLNDIVAKLLAVGCCQTNTHTHRQTGPKT